MRYPVQVDSTARHREVGFVVRMTADYGLLRALAGCGRRCAAVQAATFAAGSDKHHAHDGFFVGPIVQKMTQDFFIENRSINPDEAHRAQHSHSHGKRANIRDNQPGSSA